MPIDTAAAAEAVAKAAQAEGRALPDEIARLEAADPVLARQISGKALIASRTPIGTLLAAALAWLSAKYALGWDPAATDLFAGLGVLVGAYLMRAITRRPIAGLLTVPKK